MPGDAEWPSPDEIPTDPITELEVAEQEITRMRGQIENQATNLEVAEFEIARLRNQVDNQAAMLGVYHERQNLNIVNPINMSNAQAGLIASVIKGVPATMGLLEQAEMYEAWLMSRQTQTGGG